jgi:hypothetical protein
MVLSKKYIYFNCLLLTNAHRSKDQHQPTTTVVEKECLGGKLINFDWLTPKNTTQPAQYTI